MDLLDRWMRYTIFLSLLVLVSCDDQSSRDLGKASGAISHKLVRSSGEFLSGVVEETTKRQQEETPKENPFLKARDERMRRDYQGFPGHYDSDTPQGRYLKGMRPVRPSPSRQLESGQPLRTGAH